MAAEDYAAAYAFASSLPPFSYGVDRRMVRMPVAAAGSSLRQVIYPTIEIDIMFDELRTQLADQLPDIRAVAPHSRSSATVACTDDGET